MSDIVTTLHYASETFTLDLGTDDDDDTVEDLTLGINRVIREGGGFIEVPTINRGEQQMLRILFSPGVPVWITEVKRTSRVAPSRIR